MYLSRTQSFASAANKPARTGKDRAGDGRQETDGPDAYDGRMSEEDLRIQAQFSAFMERARWQVINRPHARDTLDGKLDALAADLKHLHTTHDSLRAIGVGGTGMPEVHVQAPAIASQRKRQGA